MTGRDGTARARRARPNVRQMAIASVCLFGAAGLMWAFLPMSEAGWYGEAGTDGLDAAAEVVPVQGRMMAYMASAGGMDGGGDEVAMMVEEMARGIAGNWVNGTITDAEYFAAMSYLYGKGYLEDAGVGPGPNAALDVADVGIVDGPAGSAQGWCKDGLSARTNAITGDMVCVPDAYADGEAGARWLDPVGEPGGAKGGDDGGGRDADDGAGGEYEAGSSTPPEITWQWRPRQDTGSYAGGGHAGAYPTDLKGRIADLENVNDGLLRTITKLQEALMEVHLQGGTGGDGGSDADDGSGQATTAEHTMTVNLTSAAPAAPAAAGGDICLHGTDATFTSVIDPAMLSETGGSLGTIPMPDGRYTVLLMAASSSPVSVDVRLAGDAGLEYDRTFDLVDTERPPGEDATMWDYNSGVAELVVGEAQLVNATAAVTGGDSMAVFAALARCR